MSQDTVNKSDTKAIAEVKGFWKGTWKLIELTAQLVFGIGSTSTTIINETEQHQVDHDVGLERHPVSDQDVSLTAQDATLDVACVPLTQLLPGLSSEALGLEKIVNIISNQKRLKEDWGVQEPISILLWGPVGSGKTEAANAFFNRIAQLDSNTKLCSGNLRNDGTDCGVATHTEPYAKLKMEEVFNEATKLLEAEGSSSTKVVIQLTHINHLDANDKSTPPQKDSYLPLLVKATKKLFKYPNVAFLMTADFNKVDDLKSVHDFTTTHILQFSLPDESARGQILTDKVRTWKVKPTESDLLDITGTTIGFTRAQLYTLASRVLSKAVSRWSSTSSDLSCLEVTSDDWKSQVDKIRRTIAATTESAEQCPKFVKELGGDTFLPDVILSDTQKATMVELSNVLRSYHCLKNKWNLSVPKGMIYFGPSGNGKSTVAKAFADHLTATGMSTTYKVLKVTPQCNYTVATMATALAGEKGTDASLTITSVEGFRAFYEENTKLPKLSEVLESVEAGSTFVIGEVNQSPIPKAIVEANHLLDIGPLEFPLPTEPQRLKFLVKLTSNWKHIPVTALLGKVASKTEALSYNELKAVSEEAVTHCWKRYLKQDHGYNGDCRLLSAKQTCIQAEQNLKEKESTLEAKSDSNCGVNSFPDTGLSGDKTSADMSNHAEKKSRDDAKSGLDVNVDNNVMKSDIQASGEPQPATDTDTEDFDVLESDWDVVLTKPSTPIDTPFPLVGMDEAVTSARYILRSFLKGNVIKEDFGLTVSQGLLLKGPPGSGKTTFAKLICSEIQKKCKSLQVTYATQADLMECKYYMVDFKANTDKLMERAMKTAPSILILDEMDALCPCDDKKSYLRALDSAANSLIQHFSRLTEAQLFVLAIFDIKAGSTTIDPKIESHPIFKDSLELTPPSSSQQRLEILRCLVKDWKAPLKEGDLQDVSQKAEGFTGKDLKELCTTLITNRVQKDKDVSGDFEPIETAEWEQPLQKVLAAKAKSKVAKGEEVADGVGLEQCVGGLTEQVNCIRRIIKSIAHQEVLRKEWGQEPPKGILFHGPPGTGKTLLAKTIVDEMKKIGIKMGFTMKKGSELFSKWFGETEKNIKEMFDEAAKTQPTLIFLDELDAFCPSRDSPMSSTAITSAVCALLGAMDDVKRGQVLVIGATNRLEGVDVALRRPGRFDRAVLFTLPSLDGRREIVKIHTKKWKNVPHEAILEFVLAQTAGYTGADLEQLTRNTFNEALVRLENSTPVALPSTTAGETQVSMATEPAALDTVLASLEILRTDWESALRRTPCSNSNVLGNSVFHGHTLMEELKVLILPLVQDLLQDLARFVPNTEESAQHKCPTLTVFHFWTPHSTDFSILNRHILPSLLTLMQSNEAKAHIFQVEPASSIREVQVTFKQIGASSHRTKILYVPNFPVFWTGLEDSGQMTFQSLYESSRGHGLILVVSSVCPASYFNEASLKTFFHNSTFHTAKVRNPSADEKVRFFRQVALNTGVTLAERFLEAVAEETKIVSLVTLMGIFEELTRSAKEIEQASNAEPDAVVTMAAKLVQESRHLLAGGAGLEQACSLYS